MKQRTPSYCLHKASGQAVGRIDGTDHYLGKYGTPQSRAEYNRLIAQWYANAQTLPAVASAPGLTVNELLLRFWAWAEDYYRDLDGNPTRELENLQHSLKPLRRLYAHSLARDFGPLALRALQDDLVERGLCRNVVNYRVNRIRRLFKWAVSFELVPPSVYQALQAVPPRISATSARACATRSSSSSSRTRAASSSAWPTVTARRRRGRPPGRGSSAASAPSNARRRSCPSRASPSPNCAQASLTRHRPDTTPSSTRRRRLASADPANRSTASGPDG